MGTEEEKPKKAVIVTSKRQFMPSWTKRQTMIAGAITLLIIIILVSWFLIAHNANNAQSGKNPTPTYAHDSNGEVLVPAPTKSQLKAAQSLATASGTITKVGGQSLAITTDAGGALSIKLDSGTLYEKAPYDSDGKFADLRAGTKVQVLYSKTTNLAQSVEYQP